ncbi:MAG: tRNA (adenine-N1)-methyltransferase [Spirochaetes bacterium]|nr:tRNA (adenine-N1)-methyltransferase [Spirochaetota bacterium]
MDKIKEHDYIIIFSEGRKYCVKADRNRNFSTKAGNIKLKEVIGKPYGIEFKKHFIFKPTLEDILLFGLKRKTQIVYPKEAFYISHKLDLKSGSKVFECGTGSGSLTMVMATHVAPSGYIYSFEKEKKFYELAKKNLESFKLYNNVKLFNKDIQEGVRFKNFDAAFLDVKEPWRYIDLVYSLLKPSCMLGIIVPTTNQISQLMSAFNNKFGCLEILEFLQRYYKINPQRIRPDDRMVGHTGYLVFARKVIRKKKKND